YPLVYDMSRTTGTYTDPAASGGNATQTGELAPLAVDGYDDTAAGSCARINSSTITGQVPWLMVDLGFSARVDRVDLLKAADPALAFELDGVDVLLGNSTTAEDNLVVLSSLSLPQPGAWATFLLNVSATGRYLVVRRPVVGAVMTVCELQAYGASAFEMRLVPAPSPSPPPIPPLSPSPRPEPSPSPPTPPAALPSPSPTPASSPSRPDKGRGSVVVGKVSTNPTAVTAVTASVVAISIGTTLTAAMVASAAAAATAATAIGSAG
ncbi:hypothetical protein VaNZ11_008292, partial [Volvox africanus]